MIKLPDGLSDFLDFFLWLFGLSKSEGEFTNFDQNVTQKSWDLFHEWLTGQQDVVGFSPVFDEFFVLVEFLETVDVDAGDSVLFTLNAVGGGSDDGDGQFGLGGVG